MQGAVRLTIWKSPFKEKLLSQEECSLLFSTYLVQQPGAAVHQLHQRETATVFQPPHVRPAGAGGVQRRHRVGVHRLGMDLAACIEAHRRLSLPFSDHGSHCWPVFRGKSQISLHTRVRFLLVTKIREGPFVADSEVDDLVKGDWVLPRVQNSTLPHSLMTSLILKPALLIKGLRERAWFTYFCPFWSHSCWHLKAEF